MYVPVSLMEIIKVHLFLPYMAHNPVSQVLSKENNVIGMTQPVLLGLTKVPSRTVMSCRINAQKDSTVGYIR